MGAATAADDDSHGAANPRGSAWDLLALLPFSHGGQEADDEGEYFDDYYDGCLDEEDMGADFDRGADQGGVEMFPVDERTSLL